MLWCFTNLYHPLQTYAEWGFQLSLGLTNHHQDGPFLIAHASPVLAKRFRLKPP